MARPRRKSLWPICSTAAGITAFVQEVAKARTSELNCSACPRRAAAEVEVAHDSRSAVAQGDVLAAILRERGGRRDFVPIDRAFLQRRDPGGGAGPLAAFVRAHRKRALDLYLLGHALASAPPYDGALPSWAWARAFGMPETASSKVFISTTWTWLTEQRLVRSERDGNRRRLFLLDESGSGAPYLHSRGGKRLDYFKLPYTYWLDGWSDRLGLPATAVLLISLSLPQTFVLPQDHGARWYGLSRDTIRRGLRSLVDLNLLDSHSVYKRAPLSPTGAAEQRHYRLREPFARTGAHGKWQARGKRRVVTDSRR